MSKSCLSNFTFVFLLCFFIVSCKSDEDPKVSAEEDTRVLVKDAYAHIDHMKLGVAFAGERAAMLQNKIANSTDIGEQLNLSMQYGTELLKQGKTSDAITVFEQTLDYIVKNDVEIDGGSKRMLMSMIGISYMRQGEIENCLQNHNHESCFLPIQGKGIHQLPDGSRGAIIWFKKLLEEFPKDPETVYLINLAYMTLGEYPQKVPKDILIPPDWFKSKIPFPKFKDVAANLGVNHFGLSGGTVVDDFTNDGWLDIVVTSWGVDKEMIFYVNNGDGTFTDKTEAYGLKGQVASLNLNQTDFNNDGWLDLYLMRGGWYGDVDGNFPNTLLMNTGKGSFVDVTIGAGLTAFGCTQTSAWTDIDLDGWIDLIVPNESISGKVRGINLYINQKDGTFRHQPTDYGLSMNGLFKGCVAPDVNNDRYPDLFISNLKMDNVLLVNQDVNGKRVFKPIESTENPGKPLNSFPCWSFDYDNDGLEDLFVSGYSFDLPSAMEWMNSKMGKPDKAILPKLYHNKGNLKFEEVGFDMGLNEVAFTMGCNYGDINTDGFLDFYLATGNPHYQSLVPNKMYLNMEGKSFEDVSYAGGFANIQKGHGVGFGDLDHDGDEDIYVVIGGAYEGDGFYNCLFENPNADKNNWVVLKLVGTTANKAAIGARLTISVQEGGVDRKICRTVTSGASFGGNSFAIEAGLRKATSINSVTIQWPCKDCPDQVFTGLDINKSYLITQGEAKAKMQEYTYVPFSTKQNHSAHEHH